MRDTVDLGDHGWVTDGGLETDLLFNKGVELPDFAAFPLVEDPHGRGLLGVMSRHVVRSGTARP